MSDDFFKELESILDNQYIVIADACALFAGWCPIGDFTSNYGRPDENRRYKRISDGVEATPSQEDFDEMRFFHDKWEKSDFQVPTRHPYINHGDIVSSEVSVRDAFKVGLGFRDERIWNLFDAAVEAGIIPDESYSPTLVQVHHHHVSKDVTGVTAQGEVGQVQVIASKPSPQFKVEGNPTKPNTKLLFRFCEYVRDLGRPIPEADDFLVWVQINRPTQPHITIEFVTHKAMTFTNNGDPDPKPRNNFDKDAITKRIDKYCK